VVEVVQEVVDINMQILKEVAKEDKIVLLLLVGVVLVEEDILVELVE
jgi:hypothetical protein